jgi:hypothetical protein
MAINEISLVSFIAIVSLAAILPAPSDGDVAQAYTFSRNTGREAQTHLLYSVVVEVHQILHHLRIVRLLAVPAAVVGYSDPMSSYFARTWFLITAEM